MRILLVEDNALIAMMVAEELEQAGFEVAGPAFSSTQALEIVSAAPCDCALVDIDLADGRTGPSLGRRLSGETQIVTIYLSGQRQLAMAESEPAAGLLPKPVDPGVLLETIRAVSRWQNGDDPDWPAGFVPFV